jgi:hypothetical protein
MSLSVEQLKNLKLLAFVLYFTTNVNIHNTNMFHQEKASPDATSLSQFSPLSKNFNCKNKPLLNKTTEIVNMSNNHKPYDINISPSSNTMNNTTKIDRTKKRTLLKTASQP